MPSKAVSKRNQVDYAEFCSHPEPLTLQAELAHARTFLVEFRESIENRKLDRVVQFADQVSRQAITKLQISLNSIEGCEDVDFDPEDYKEVADLVIQLYAANFGEVAANLTPGDMLVLTKSLQTISQIAERAKKIEDGITLKLEWSKDLAEKLTKFIVQVVFRHVTDPEVRKEIAHSSREFFSSSFGRQAALQAGDAG